MPKGIGYKQSECFFKVKQRGYECDDTSNMHLKQIQKDVYARDVLKEVKGIVWHFFESEVTGKQGPSGPLYDYLIENGIEVIIY